VLPGRFGLAGSGLTRVCGCERVWTAPGRALRGLWFGQHWPDRATLLADDPALRAGLGTGPSLARLGAGAPNHDRLGLEAEVTRCGYSLAYRRNLVSRQELRVRA